MVRREQDKRALAAMEHLRTEEQELLRLALWSRFPTLRSRLCWGARPRRSPSGSTEQLDGSPRSTSVSTTATCRDGGASADAGR